MESEILRESIVRDRLVAVASLLMLAFLTWVIARLVASKLRGRTRLGLRSLERLAAPLTLVVTVVVAWRILEGTAEDPAIVELAVELLLVAAVFWLGARVLDVGWATASGSARLRRQASANSALLAGKLLGKVALFLSAVAVISVRLGVGEQLYLALGAIGAALAFAARAPIANLVSFGEMMLDPPFHIGDRVRIEHYRGGAPVVGKVIAITLGAVTVRSRSRTAVVVANSMIDQLRVENLSKANRRRLEIAFPLREGIPAETLRSACEVIERDLREHPRVSAFRQPRVWVAGFGSGLRLEASVWLRRGSDRRDAQRELVLLIGERLDELVPPRPAAH